MRTPAVLFGIPIDDLTMDTTIDRIGDFVTEGRLHHRSHQIATVNVDFVVNALGDDGLLRLLQNNALNLADGMPLVWASTLVDTSLRERVAGSDLVPALAAASAERSWRIHLFGGAEGVADRARAMLLERHPRAHITADAGPTLDDVTDVGHDVIERITQHDPDILCVAFGNPKQERFIAAQQERLGCPVMIGIGGSLDLLVGRRRRAPAWAQRIGAEWLVRAAQEPRRLGRRYGHDLTIFAPSMMDLARTARRYRNSPDLTLTRSGNVFRVSAGEGTSEPQGWQDVNENELAGATIILEFGETSEISPRSHNALIGLLRAGVRQNVTGIREAWTQPLRECLTQFGTLTWLEHVTTETSLS